MHTTAKYFIYSLFTGIGFLLLSCDNSKNKPAATKEKSGIVQDHSKITHRGGEKLKAFAKKEILTWKAYWDMDAFLKNYHAISGSEALSNAKELSSLAQKMKDSLKIPLLKTPDVLTRINILQNECLRLNDMAEITAITPEEVKYEVHHILDAFSALNAKINAVYTLRHLENELELDPDFTKVLQRDSLEKKDVKPVINHKKPTHTIRKIQKIIPKLKHKNHAFD